MIESIEAFRVDGRWIVPEYEQYYGHLNGSTTLIEALTIFPQARVSRFSGEVRDDCRRVSGFREAVAVRPAGDLEGVDALILPGGESTTISKGLERLGLYEPLEPFARAGHPILGTCAGAVLLAREVENHPVRSLGLLDVVAVRNAYGTQVDSFAAVADSKLDDLRCIFMRAPRLRRPGPEVEVLARVDGWPVFVRQGKVLATTFHPELGHDLRVHGMLLELAA